MCHPKADDLVSLTGHLHQGQAAGSPSAGDLEHTQQWSCTKCPAAAPPAQPGQGEVPGQLRVAGFTDSRAVAVSACTPREEVCGSTVTFPPPEDRPSSASQTSLLSLLLSSFWYFLPFFCLHLSAFPMEFYISAQICSYLCIDFSQPQHPSHRERAKKSSVVGLW